MIRKPESKNDWSEIRRICCETGSNGAPIKQDRWNFFAEHWIGPYEKLFPEWTWIATQTSTKAGEEIIGYLTGCPDTVLLEQRRILRFDLPLIFLILQKRFPMNSDVRKYLKRRFGIEKSPERAFPENIQSMLRKLYPAHLHINLSEQARGNGTGRKLIETFFETLRENRVPGVHVHCGSGPLAFYERLGFQTLHSLEFRPGVHVYCLGLAL